jgi:glycosyltransferase involved in cell wall biosynthesis
VIHGGDMNILHYSLGLPPYRTGGLTKYSIDLMKEQVKNEDSVFLLFPGEISIFYKTTKLISYKDKYGIKVYEIVNPLPVPLLNGISEPLNFMKSCDKQLFKKFLINNKIQIVHIHTFMGLYKEFLEACKDLNIKIVYTTHDYFGICTKVNFIDYKGNLCDERNIEKCLTCNMSGYDMNLITVLQSPLYRFLKNKGIINKLGSLKKGINEKNKIKSNFSIIEKKVTSEYRTSYNDLIKYYSDMFSYIDVFLFNSTVAEEVYRKYIDKSGEVVSITHGDITDNRKVRDYSSKKLKMTYLGPYKKYKGFDLLIEIVKEINKEYKKDIELNLYGDIYGFEIEDNIKIHGKYEYNQLSNIFDNTDLLIVPSIWHETFGFIVLESISYGVPVLLTENVGAKDIINNRKNPSGIIINVCKDSLKLKIIEILNNRDILFELNKNILSNTFDMDIFEHYKKIKSIYDKLWE